MPVVPVVRYLKRFKLISHKKYKNKYQKPFALPGGNYMVKVNNRNTKTRYGIYSKLTIKTIKRHQVPTI